MYIYVYLYVYIHVYIYSISTASLNKRCRFNDVESLYYQPAMDLCVWVRVRVCINTYILFTYSAYSVVQYPVGGRKVTVCSMAQ